MGKLVTMAICVTVIILVRGPMSASMMAHTMILVHCMDISSSLFEIRIIGGRFEDLMLVVYVKRVSIVKIHLQLLFQGCLPTLRPCSFWQ